MARLVLKELAHRKLNALLSAMGIVTAVALFVAFFTTADASNRETTRLMRDLGFNLRIIPRATDMEQFWTDGYSAHTMAEDTVRQLASAERVFLVFNHLVATLQERVTVGDQEVILTGLARAITAPAQQQQPMGFAIEPGTVYLGFHVAQRLRLKAGDAVHLGSMPFTVARCLAESGTDDDIRVFGWLPDVQRFLNRPGRINEIKAIDCLCLTSDQDALAVSRAELDKFLPEAKVVQLRTLADARARQRQTVERYAAFLTPCLLTAAAAWIGVLAVLNVRERRLEIGILRALGYGSMPIAGLFLARAILLGVAGAVAGYALGSALAIHFGPGIFQMTAKSIRLLPSLFLGSLLTAPAFAAMAGFIPAVLAVNQDPAETLREV
ncbi:MAG TPA: FtsX-like permease family protein [Verrucomicrobiota bacterium]|nr:FtsX-like permease family protein [Verrucomicrobiota bacterium]